MSEGRPHRLPGDREPAEEIARMLRVDHAGEYGATRIYEGQLDVLGRSRGAGEIRRMAETEKRHLSRFDTLLRERRVRPTLLHPLWTVAGYAVGAATSSITFSDIGKKLTSTASNTSITGNKPSISSTPILNCGKRSSTFAATRSRIARWRWRMAPRMSSAMS